MADGSEKITSNNHEYFEVSKTIEPNTHLSISFSNYDDCTHWNGRAQFQKRDVVDKSYIVVTRVVDDPADRPRDCSRGLLAGT